MKVVFSQKIPKNQPVDYVDFSFGSPIRPTTANLVPIRPIIDARIDIWQSEINLWHASLIKSLSSIMPDWWRHVGSRLISWHPASFRSLYFALALSHHLNEQAPDLIYVLNAPDDVRTILQDLHCDLEIERRENDLWVGIIETLREHVQNKCLFLLQIFRSFLFANKPIFPDRRSRSASADIVFSRLLRPQSRLPSEVPPADQYFGRMFDELSDRSDTQIWIYPASDRKFINQKATSTSRSVHLATTSLVKRWQIVAIVIRLFANQITLKKNRKLIPTLCVNGRKLTSFTHRFFQHYFIDSPTFESFEMEMAVRNLQTHFSIRSAILPYEEKSEMRAALAGLDTSVRTLGFAHAAHNDGLLYLEHQSSPSPPRPQVIGATGPDAKAFLNTRFSVPASNVQIIGSPKFIQQSKSEFTHPLNVLFVVSDATELFAVVDCVVSNADFFSRIPFGIKPYPFGYVRKQREAIEMLIRHLPAAKIFSADLNSATDWADISVFDSSSAGIEAILAGNIGLHFKLDQIIKRSALCGKSLSSSVTQCVRAEELVKEIARFQNSSPSELARIANEQHSSAQRIFAKPDLRKLAHCLFGT